MLGEIRSDSRVLRPQGIRFGNQALALKQAAQLGEKAVVDVAHCGTAEKLFKFFSKDVFNRDVRVGGLSLEDVAARAQTIIGVYLMQGYLAVKDHKHPWETNGRNITVWLMTTFLTQFLKNDHFGVNTLLLNPFMKPKVTDSAAIAKLGPIERWINKKRLDINYIDIVKRAGITVKDEDLAKVVAGKKSLWASLDTNKIDRINNLYEELNAAAKSGGKEALDKLKQEGLEATDKQIFEAMPAFLRRINAFPLISTALITACTVYIIGSLAMKITYSVFAKHDKDFDPNAVAGKKKHDTPAAPQASGGQPAQHQLSISQPNTFAAFAANKNNNALAGAVTAGATASLLAAASGRKR